MFRIFCFIQVCTTQCVEPLEPIVCDKLLNFLPIVCYKYIINLNHYNKLIARECLKEKY